MENLEDAGRGSPDHAPGQPLTGEGKNLRNGEGRWLAMVIVLIFLILWEVLTRLSAKPGIFFPAPSRITLSLWQMLVDGELLLHLGVTLKRLLLGLLLGCVPGVLIGLAMGWSRILYLALDPIISALHPIPKIAILPLFLIIFGIGDLSKIMLIAVASFFPMVINSMAGVHQINRTYFDVARNYGASRLQTFRCIVIPGSLPMIMTGFRLALNIALLLTIAAELLAAQEGLGTLISFAWRTMRVTELYAVLIVIALLGIFFAKIVQWLTHWLVPWQDSPVSKD